MNFGQALEIVKAGHRVYRSGWNGKGMYIELAGPYFVESACKTSLLFIHMKTADNNFIPWLASQTDILAEDWEEA